ncbi:MAG: hypothetical protein LLG04_01285 [Parachlamydia sp.]|nr:hypothetical protein [Parachlamydia sp.]
MFNNLFEEFLGAAALGACYYVGQKKGRNEARLIVDQEYMQKEIEELRKTVEELRKNQTT